MSHEVEQMAYAGEVPWHGLGTRVPNNISIDDMLEHSGLNWTVSKQDMYWKEINNFDENQIIKANLISDKQLLVRDTDNMQLDVVGRNWNPVQNHEAFDFFRQWIEEGDMEMHTAGSLMNGKLTWVLAKVNDTFDVVPNDPIESYMLFSNPHQFGHSLNIRFTPTRVVCNNTLQLALSKHKSGLTLNHRSKFNADEVKTAMGLVTEAMDIYKTASKFLASKAISSIDMNDYFKHLFPQKDLTKGDLPSRNHKKATEAVWNQPGGNKGFGTWWHAFNTVTYLYDHKIGRNTESRLRSNWYGNAALEKRKAFKKALELANN